ncbi:MAG: efflux RND transporter periplasmic adaptor subunit [Deltaproteobacteria bacterium HGW-Deltaproteobacteria-13]|jgi:multidrug efflux system membrane fusion protein|nr:MAG: efflux RND transporter periplasmic adaptor subunit [Deltaproteobacteria bacterium HGW-Deltaproteobacteria-13]
MKKLIAGVTILALIACGLFTACSKTPQETSGAKTGKERAIPVMTANVITKEVPVEIKTFGNVQAHSSIQVKAEVGGNLARVHFRKGQSIKAGDLLFSIDSRSYKAALDQANANLARDRALEKNALINAERSKELLQQGFISRSDDDTAQANAASLTAVVKADEAAIVNAKLQVEHCSIRSPINGKVGDILVPEGTLIKANDVPMVTINQIRPIEVFFSIPQAELPAVRKQMAVRKLKVMASLPQDTRPPEAGDLFFIDNTIDKTTGTVQLAGTFSNDREVLWPGQYVNVTLVLSIQKDALVVPSVAVQTGREGKFVFAVKPDNTVEVRPVIARMAAGEETVIEKGLQAGERVVTDGQLGLVPGSRIEIKNDIKSNSKTPGGRS